MSKQIDEIIHKHTINMGFKQRDKNGHRLSNKTIKSYEKNI